MKIRLRQMKNLKMKQFYLEVELLKNLFDCELEHLMEHQFSSRALVLLQHAHFHCEFYTHQLLCSHFYMLFTMNGRLVCILS